MNIISFLLFGLAAFFLWKEWGVALLVTGGAGYILGTISMVIESPLGYYNLLLFLVGAALVVAGAAIKKRVGEKKLNWIEKVEFWMAGISVLIVLLYVLPVTDAELPDHRGY